MPKRSRSTFVWSKLLTALRCQKVEAEEVRLKKKMNLRDVVESIPEGFCIYDADERFIMCNEAFRQLYWENASAFVPGARYEDIMRSALAVGRYPEAIGREEEWLAEWMRKHRKGEASVESRLRDGRWVLVSERRMPNGGVAGLRIDITRVKSAEEALRENRAELQKMAEELRRSNENLARAQRITHTGSVVRDLTRPDKVEFSGEMYRLLGWDLATPPPPKEAFLQIFHPEDRAKLLQVTSAAEEGRPTEPIDVRVMRPDGTVRWLHNNAETLFDDEGRPSSRIATFTDVTEIREAEQMQRELEQSLRMAKEAAEAAKKAVLAANEELELRVEERTRELRETQEELIKKERLSALGQLTATVAHELRNPLSAIRNTVHTIRETVGTELPRFERPLGRLDRSIVRCEAIISDLLHFTRPKKPARFQVRFDEWLGNLLNEHKVPESIRMERQLGASGARVALDREQFERVMINLMDNAVHAIVGNGQEPGTGRIVVTTTLVAHQLTVLIQDTGPGIPADVLPHIFEPLFTTKSFGTGLGLPTVKQIVEQHDGIIDINSEAGHGTTVRICLATVQEPAVAA